MFAGKMHLLAWQLATTRVEPEEHRLPAVTVPGPIMMMMMMMMIVRRRRMTVMVFVMRIKLEGRNIGCPL